MPAPLGGRNALAKELDASALEDDAPGDGANQGGLPGAVGAEECQELALLELDRSALERLNVAEGLGRAAHVQDGLRCAGGSLARGLHGFDDHLTPPRWIVSAAAERYRLTAWRLWGDVLDSSSYEGLPRRFFRRPRNPLTLEAYGTRSTPTA